MAGNDLDKIFARFPVQGAGEPPKLTNPLSGAIARSQPRPRLGEAWLQDATQRLEQLEPPPSDADLSLGDVMELSPEDADRLGMSEAADLIGKVRYRMGGPTLDKASPFSSEWGQQQFQKLRTIPLQRSTGQFGMDIPSAQKALSDLYFMRSAKRQGLDLATMTPEQYKALRGQSDDDAKREVKSITEVHEQQGNVLAPLDVNKMVEDTRAGRNLPLPLYLTTPGWSAIGAQAREKVFGTKAEDQFLMNVFSPFFALARPGVVEDSEEGHPVAKRESKMGWMFRLQPSTAITSWLLDPNLSWSLGGETGFGGKQHIEKIVRGYDVTAELPQLAEKYDELVPWKAGPWEKMLAAALPVGALLLVEPDAISVGTGLVGAPAAKLAKEYGLGLKVMEHVYAPAIKEWKAAAAAGASLDQILEMAGPKGSMRRIAFDAVMGDTLAEAARRAGGEVGGNIGPIRDINPISASNAPKLQEEAGHNLSAVHQELKSVSDEVTRIADSLDGEMAAKTRAAADAVQDYADKERLMVQAAVLRGGVEELTPGDLVMLRNGEVGQFKNFRASVVGGKGKAVEEGPVAVVRKYVEYPPAQAMEQVSANATDKLDPLYRTVERMANEYEGITVDGVMKTFGTSEERARNILRQLEERKVIQAPFGANAKAPPWMADEYELVPKAERTELDPHLIEESAPHTVPVGRLVPMDPEFKGGVHELPRGALAIDSLTGQIVHVDGFRAGVERVPWKLPERGTQVVIQTAEGERLVPLTEVSRLANPDKWQDTKKVLYGIQSAKKEFTRLQEAAAHAREVGDLASLSNILRKMGVMKGALVKNVADMDFAMAEVAYRQARERMTGAMSELDRFKATGESLDPKVVDNLRQLDRLNKQLQGLLGKETELARHKAALDELPQIFTNVLDRYEKAFSDYRMAVVKGQREVQPLGRAVLDQVVEGNRLDGPKYALALTEKYGSDALDKALRSPMGQPFVRILENVESLSPSALGKVRDFERAVHGAAEAQRLGQIEPAANIMRTLAEQKMPFSFTAEHAMARGYQMAQSMARASDWVGATAIGRAPRVVREVVRRGYERFAMIENDFGVVGKEHGIAGVRKYLLTTDHVPGAVANLDAISLADKALNYLRAISYGEGWAMDPVVEALKNAPLPSGFAADKVNQTAGAILKDLVQKEETTGAELMDYLERVLPGLYGKQLGKADNPDVIFRFVARAVGYAASQHDTMYDLLRTTGGGINRAAAEALNFFNVPEQGKLAAFDIKGAREASATYGIPKLIEQRGELQAPFKTKHVLTELVKYGEAEGEEFYLPRSVIEAMAQVPRDLAKEMAEFSKKGTYMGNRLDRLSRLWRVTVVNGYFVPRAAYFVNNYLSDIAQVGTTFGVKEGARMAIQALPSYIPFVGPRLQERLMEAGKTSSILGALFDPMVKRVLDAGEDELITMSDGAITARRALHEAREDGCFDSMSTRELAEITRRGQKRWDPLEVPKHIELSARFMETIQSRNRLGVYLRARMSGLTRQEARDKLVEALYDWKTGVPTWEHASIGRAVVFMSYRRNMIRQLGAALTEGISDPSVQFGWKALTGQTKIGRMMKFGRLTNALPNLLYWTDPLAQLDDEAQLHEWGMRTAPWWVTSQAILGNREVSPERELWYSEVAGRKVTFESLMLPAITTLDQLYLVNLFLQTGAATVVGLSEKAGLSPNLTTVQADEVYEKNIQFLSDMLAPGLDEFAANALRANFTSEGSESSPRGIPLPKAQAVFLRRLGWDDFMAAHPDPDGQIRMDPNAYGLLTQMIWGLPPVSDLTRNWLIFADNPGYQESLQTGLAEAMMSWTGLARPQGFNPQQSSDYAAAEAERRIKGALSSERKRVFTREELTRR